MRIKQLLFSLIILFCFSSIAFSQNVTAARVDLIEGAVPANPTSGRDTIYAKTSDSTIHIVSATGVDFTVTGIAAGTGVTASTTNRVTTISIGQAIGTGNTPTFAGLNISGTTITINSGGNQLILSSSGQTSNHTVTFPNSTGTVLYNNGNGSSLTGLGGDLSGTIGTASVATVGGATAVNIADAVTKRHTQGTDTGTTSSTFSIQSGGSAGIIDTSLLSTSRTFKLPDLGGSPTFLTTGTLPASFPTLNQDTTGNAASVTGLSVVNGKTLTVNKTITLDGTDGTTVTFPSTSAAIARTDAGQTFTGVNTFTSPSIITQISDTNGNSIIGLTATSSAVNGITIANAASGNSPSVSSTGSSSNIGLNLAPKGTGSIGIVTGITTGTGTSAAVSISSASNTLRNGALLDLTSTSSTSSNYDGRAALQITDASAFGGSAFNGTVYGAKINITATQSGTLTNVGLSATASGATNNYAIIATGRVGINNTSPTAQLHVTQSASTNSTSAPVMLNIDSVGGSGQLTASSSVQTFAQIAPVINQTSTAGYTALKINSTETGTGSGTKLLLDAQVGGVSKFSIDNNGYHSNLKTSDTSATINTSSNQLILSSSGLTGNRTITFPNASCGLLGDTGFNSNGTGTISRTFAANTPGDGFILAATGTASSGNQFYSSRLRLSGSGWKTNATAGAQQTDWTIDNRPVQGTSNPTSVLTIQNQTNAGGYTTKATLDDSGILTATGNIYASNGSAGFGAGSYSQSFYLQDSSGNLCSIPSRREVITKTADYSVTGFNDSNGVITNNGAAGTVILTLPSTPAIGNHYIFYVLTAQTLRVKAGGASATIRLGATASATNGTIESNTVGNSITIIYAASNQWVVTSHEGTWTIN